MKLPTRTASALAAAFALTVLPAGASLAQEADCEVVEGSGSAVGDVQCPPEEDSSVGGETDEGESGVGGETETRDEGETPAGEDEDAGVLPGRMDRPQDGAPAADDAGDDAAPSIQSSDDELAATGVDADAALVAGLAALAIGGGALAAGRRRSRSDS